MFVIGVSGVTNGGKTTVARALHEALPRSHLICQDTYFLPKESTQHTLIPKLGHFNWEIMSSLDMDKMWNDIQLIIKRNHGDKGSIENSSFTIKEKEANKGDCPKPSFDLDVLIIEGFLVLNYKPIVDICDLKYHLTLTNEECFKRRILRNYDPPDVPGYFELCVWPEYLKHKEEMLQSVSDVKVIDGTRNIKSILEEVLNDFSKRIENDTSTGFKDSEIS